MLMKKVEDVDEGGRYISTLIRPVFLASFLSPYERLSIFSELHKSGKTICLAKPITQSYQYMLADAYGSS